MDQSKVDAMIMMSGLRETLDALDDYRTLFPDDRTIESVADIEERLTMLRRLVKDRETAHIFEDRLWTDTLRAIAAGAPNSQELAAAALESEKIEFDHWYA